MKKPNIYFTGLGILFILIVIGIFIGRINNAGLRVLAVFCVALLSTLLISVNTK